jgi:hypothetical protein
MTARVRRPTSLLSFERKEHEVLRDLAEPGARWNAHPHPHPAHKRPPFRFEPKIDRCDRHPLGRMSVAGRTDAMNAISRRRSNRERTPEPGRTGNSKEVVVMNGTALRRDKAAAISAGLTALAAAFALLIGTAGAASGKPLERVRFHDVTSEVVEDFCGDLTVRIDTDVRGTFLLNPHGHDRLAYGSEKVHGTQVITNLANDKTFTQVFSVLDKDLKVTDNGDGTLTILVLATGGSRVYGPDGKLLFNEPGQIRFEILIDHGGTPTDPSDDEFLEFLGIVKGSTGRNDLQGRDFCDDIHTFIG